MKHMLHSRASRFQRLFVLLTGATHRALPANLHKSDRLRSDVGLPPMPGADRIHHQLGGFPSDPFSH